MGHPGFISVLEKQGIIVNCHVSMGNSFRTSSTRKVLTATELMGFFRKLDVGSNQDE